MSEGPETGATNAPQRSSAGNLSPSGGGSAGSNPAGGTSRGPEPKGLHTAATLGPSNRPTRQTAKSDPATGMTHTHASRREGAPPPHRIPQSLGIVASRN